MSLRAVKWKCMRRASSSPGENVLLKSFVSLELSELCCKDSAQGQNTKTLEKLFVRQLEIEYPFLSWS